MDGGVAVLEVEGALRVKRDEGGLKSEPSPLLGIPYAYWNNRGNSPMTVWLSEDIENARPTPAPTLASMARIEVSFARGGMDVRRIQDQLMPRNATDGFAPAFDFWPNKGTAEWVSYRFDRPAKLGSVVVSWFDDTGVGECRLPASWKLSYRDSDGQWQPVTGVSGYSIRNKEPVRVNFDPVSTGALRLDVQLAEGFSGGLYEWEVGVAP